MIEKLKSALEVVKGAILYILTPVGILLGYIFYLKSKTDDLTHQLSQSQADKKLVEVLEKKKEVTYEADAASVDYTQLRNEYISEQGGSTDPKPDSKT